jgi:AcrR family transcriptional regulator
MKESIVAQAEGLFFAVGFNATTLSAICAPLKIKPASLYYHFKGGKEEIYLEVIRRRTTQLRAAIESIALSHDNLDPILREFGYWYVEQPPMNMMLIAQMDMPHLSRKGRNAVNHFVRTSVFEPLGHLFVRYKNILNDAYDPYAMVGTLSVLLFSIHTAVKQSGTMPRQLVDFNIAVFLRGVVRGGK